MSDPTNPLIVQGDLSVLAEVSSPRFDEARAKLARFAELDKAPRAHPHLPDHAAVAVERSRVRAELG
jgi:hypothetical protein